ncbi:MAG: neutral/alkaline non-lysosomal ceramidase N-terminal domain-containing protein [Fermentimonas sp.]
MFFILLSSLLQCIHGKRHAEVPTWKAGVAATAITPQEPVWMGGYSSRTRPVERKVHDLWAKALYLEDAGKRGVFIITCDLVGLSKAVSDRVKDELLEKTGLPKAQVILNCSHTHSGPVTSGNLINIYPIDSENLAVVDQYTERLCKQLVALSVKAKRNAEPAKVFSQNGTVRFQVNRRKNMESEITNLTELKGPSDYSVPVLKVEDEKGNMKAVVFGYACHPTVLNGYEWCGDYPGFAQVELEKLYPGTTALFFQGAGADQNPLPRRSIPLAKQYGKELAAAVERVIDEPMRELQPRLETAYSEISLEMETPPGATELKRLKEEYTIDYFKRWAESMLGKLRRGEKLPSTYSYPVQVWQLGGQTIVALGGELMISYAIRLKELLGEDIFVMGYSNDVTGYIPSDAELSTKWGEEIESSHFEFDLPAKWKPGLEKVILDEVVDLANRMSM